MIIPKIFYGIKCERCGDIFEDGEGSSYWADEDSAFENASEGAEWIEIKSKHFCEGCYEVDEETDEIKVKESYPVYIQEIIAFLNKMTLAMHVVVVLEDVYKVQFRLYHSKKLHDFEVNYIKSLLSNKFISIDEVNERSYIEYTILLEK